MPCSSPTDSTDDHQANNTLEAGRSKPSPSVLVSMEMKQHSSVRRLLLLAKGLSMQADRKSHFPRLVVSQETGQFSF